MPSNLQNSQKDNKSEIVRRILTQLLPNQCQKKSTHTDISIAEMKSESVDLSIVPFHKDKQLDDFANDSIPPKYSNPKDFLYYSLSQKKIESIYQKLRKFATIEQPRTLHEQKIYGRTIVVTENSSLHLVTKGDSTIFIQPLLPCLTNYEFFKYHITNDKELYQLASGLLRSYANIIEFKSDFRIAQNIGLIPNEWDWKSFQNFRDSLLSCPFLDQSVHPRYQYGELPLRQLNKYYLEVASRNVPYHGCDEYFTEGWLVRYSKVLLFFFAFSSLVLSSMQVALAQPPDSCPLALRQTSLWFSIIMLIFLAFAAIAISFFTWLVTTFQRFGGFDQFAKYKEDEQKREQGGRVAVKDSNGFADV